MKNYNEIADRIVETTLHLKKGMTDAGFHLDIRHSVVENFANSIIEYEFSKMRANRATCEKIQNLHMVANLPESASGALRACVEATVALCNAAFFQEKPHEEEDNG